MNYHGGDIYTIKNKVTDFSTNINPMGVPESFRKALNERLMEYTVYTDNQYVSVKKCLAEYLNVPYDSIAPGSGAVDVIYKTIRACKAENVIVAAPTFSEYERAANAADVNVTQVFCYDFEHQSLNLEKLKPFIVKNSIVIVCNPNNPTGSLINKKTLTEICVYLKSRGCYLMIDEAFMDFIIDCKEYTMCGLIAESPNLIVIRAATKFFGMPGMRLGCGIFGSKALLEQLEEISEPWCLNTSAVIGAEVLFQDKNYIKSSIEWIQNERPLMYQALSKLEGIKVFESQANFHLLQIKKEGLNAEQLWRKMLSKGFLIRRGEGFYGLDESFFRLAVKNNFENMLLIKALSEALEEV